VHAKIRHRHEPAAATIEKIGTDEVLVTFDEPQRAVTPGQATVFYDEDTVVGGGWFSLPSAKRKEQRTRAALPIQQDR
jgi:tRNA-specific 2-thiouridylase